MAPHVLTEDVYRPDNVIDTATLKPLTKAMLQEALREVAAAQKRFPRLAALR